VYEVWIKTGLANWIYYGYIRLFGTTRDYTLQITVTYTSGLSQFFTALLGSGFQRPTFTFLWILELPRPQLLQLSSKQFANQLLNDGPTRSSKLLYDWRSASQSVSQSVGMSWYRAPLWDLRTDITSCRKVEVWNLRSCFHGTPSLTRARVRNLQCNHSMVRVAQTRNHILLSHLRLPQPGGLGTCIYIPQEQGDPGTDQLKREKEKKVGGGG
jgi:hypothetical protein